MASGTNDVFAWALIFSRERVARARIIVFIIDNRGAVAVTRRVRGSGEIGTMAYGVRSSRDGRDRSTVKFKFPSPS